MNYEQFDFGKDFFFVLFRQHSIYYFTALMCTMLIPFVWTLVRPTHKDFWLNMYTFFGYGLDGILDEKFAFVRYDITTRIGICENIP